MLAENEQAYNLFQQDQVPREASLSHELVGGAAAFYAMRKYEEHLANTGQEPSHALFKEILAGAAGFEVDRLVETKGLDSIDRYRAKQHAEEQAEQMFNARYRQDQYQAPPQNWGYNLGGGPYLGGGGSYNQGEYGGQQGGYDGGGPQQGGYGGQQGGYGGQQGYGGGY